MNGINPELVRKLKDMFSVLNNESRLKILFLCKDKELTITEISKQLKLGYPTTCDYVGLLERERLVSKRRRNTETLVKSLVEFDDKEGDKVKIYV